MDPSAEQQRRLCLLDPSGQAVPVQQQGVVGDLQMIVETGEDAGPDEGFSGVEEIVAERGRGDPPSEGEGTLDVEQREQEPPRRPALARGERLVDRVGLLVECRPQAARGEIVGLRDGRPGRCLPALAQHAGQQGEHDPWGRLSVGVDVTQEQLGEFGADGASVLECRAFDDLDEVIARDGPEHDRRAEVSCEPLVAHGEPDRVRPQRQHAGDVLGKRTEPFQGGSLPLRDEQFQLLELVDHQQGRLVGQLQAGDIGRIGQERDEVCQLAAFAGRAPDQAGREQRRLAGAGLAEQHDDVGGVRIGRAQAGVDQLPQC